MEETNILVKNPTDIVNFATKKIHLLSYRNLVKLTKSASPENRHISTHLCEEVEKNMVTFTAVQCGLIG